MCEQDRQGPWSHAAYNVVKGVKQQKGNQKKKKCFKPQDNFT